ncbi:MAG: hypothetical protein P4N59_05570 [Negativicutes bacterium]|nr:hypothetical protein [Negativicutes bacterium]
MTNRKAGWGFAALMAVLLPQAAYATSSGLDTTIPDMVFAVQGQQVGDWTNSNLAITGGLNTTSTVGIGTSTPAAQLDVSGGIRTGFDGSICGPSNEGTQRYNPSLHAYEYCNATSWTTMGGGMTLVVGGCQYSWSTCPAGYRATSYFSPGTYNCCDKCGNPAWRYTVCSQ